MMDKLKIPLKTHQCFIGNLEPDNKDGCYPDWSRARAGRQVYKFKRPTKHQEEKVVRHMEKHRGAALHWFQNGHPMKTVTARYDATRVSKLLERSPRNGTAASDRRLLFGNRGKHELVRNTNSVCKSSKSK